MVTFPYRYGMGGLKHISWSNNVGVNEVLFFACLWEVFHFSHSIINFIEHLWHERNWIFLFPRLMSQGFVWGHKDMHYCSWICVTMSRCPWSFCISVPLHNWDPIRVCFLSYFILMFHFIVTNLYYDIITIYMM